MTAPVLQVKRGALSNLPGLRAGEPAFTTDSFDFYVGIDSTSNNNKFVGSHRYWTKGTATTGSGVRFVERTDGGSNYIELKAPDTALAGNVTYVLPGTQGVSQTVLTNDGSGNLSWSSGSNNATFTGITTFSDTTDSTTKDNGAIIVEGGVGIEKSVNIGGNLSVAGVSTFVGNVTFQGGTINLGDSNTDDIVVAGEFKSDLTPTDDATYNLGAAGKRWRNAIFSGIVTATTFSGNATSADQVKTVTASDTNANYYVTFVDSHNGSSTNEYVYTDDGIYYNPGTNTFITQYGHFTGDVTVDGSIVGTASTATRATLIDTTGTSSNADYYVTFVDTLAGQTGETLRVGAGLSVNPSDGSVKTKGILSVGNPSALTSYIKAGGGSNALYLYANGEVSFQSKAVVNEIRSGSNASTLITLSDLDATFARDVRVTGIVTATTFVGNLSGTATNANYINITTKTSDDNTYYVPFESGIGNTSLYVDTALTYNPGRDELGVTNLTGISSIKSPGDNLAITLSSANVEVRGELQVSGNIIKSSTGATVATLSANDVQFSDDVTVGGNLYVMGQTTEVETTNLKVEDSLIDLGLVQSGTTLVAPTSDLNIDIGILLNWYSGTAKKAAFYWDDSAQRIAIASEVSESSNVLTASVYAPVEIGALWVNDCAGQSQVISCTGAERFLNNITVDCGSF